MTNTCPQPITLAFVTASLTIASLVPLVRIKHGPDASQKAKPNLIFGTAFTIAQTIIRAIIPVLGADCVILTTRGDEVYHAHLWIVPQYIKAVEIRQEAQSVANLLRRALLI